jgi:LPS-assembly protein
LVTNTLKRGVVCAVALTLLTGPVAEAQISGLEEFFAGTTERLSENHWRLTGQVEIGPSDVKLFADSVDYFTDTKQLRASGNVVFTQTDQRIAADRVDFNLDTQTGTFYSAYGIMGLGVQREPSLFGTQEPDVYFYGETVEKIGPQRYKVTKGGFTTCVQPSPRWELTSGTVVLNLERYAVLRNSLFKVKGVPVLYLPVFYYPINKEDRATGFLIPQYGVSTIRGHTLGNAFFWAINRSHDATFLYDLFSRTGQGTGGEYRYVTAPGSEGNARAYLLNEHEATYQNSDGTTTSSAGRRSYEIHSNANQAIARGLRARGRVDYFSNITVQQTYHTNIADASARSRTISAALTKAWGTYNVTGAYERSETFYGTTSSSLNGGTPSVTFARSEQPIGASPVYYSLNSNYAHLLRESRSPDITFNSGLDRLDILPLVRVPFTRWPFLTINSSATWRNTFWSESLDTKFQQTATGISRQYFDFQTQLVGPVFARIFDTPENRYAQRFKHSIEPFFNLQRLTAIDQYARIVKLDGVDQVIGKTTRYTYGLNNRFYAKRMEGSSTAATAREIASVTIGQTYYTDARAAQFDASYSTSFTGVQLLPSNFSPISIQTRIAPTLQSSGTFRAEYDTQFGAFRQLGADATIVLPDRLQSTVGWSQRRFIKGLPGFNDPSQLTHFLNQSTVLRTKSNRFGALYSFNYDARLNSFLQQRIMGYYNAQCCGFTVEYQTFDLSGLAGLVPVTQDRRFNVSFTLAGIGSFSNFFGALGGTP